MLKCPICGADVTPITIQPSGGRGLVKHPPQRTGWWRCTNGDESKYEDLVESD